MICQRSKDRSISNEFRSSMASIYSAIRILWGQWIYLRNWKPVRQTSHYYTNHAILLNLNPIILFDVSDASHVIGLFPDLLPPEQRNKLEYPAPIPELQGKDLEDGLSALVKFLIEV